MTGGGIGGPDPLPLSGVRVVVTRARAQADELCDRLGSLGAEPVLFPVIEIAPPFDGGATLAATLERLREYDWVVFTSVNTVDRVLPLADPTVLCAVRVAAIGPGTAAALGAGGVQVDLVPPQFVAESLLDVLPEGPGRVLLPRAAVARDVLPEGLRERGWEVDVVEAYRTIEATPEPEALAAAASADVITFTASSTVTNYVRIAGVASLPPVVVCIGPITQATAVESGITVDVTADEHTIDGLVRAVVAAVSLRRDFR